MISSLINVVYNVWFYVVFGVMAWQAASLRDPRLRLQFLLSFVLTWALLGSLAATLLSSAGPVYYGRVTGLEDVYAPLMAYLHAADERYPIWALGVQEMLWTHYQHVIAGAGSGISAMPSMHVGTSVLFTLLGWRAHRLLGLAFAAFTGVILVGSVHLGWHYAVDGYVAIVATCLIWVVVGRALARSADAPDRDGPSHPRRSPNRAAATEFETEHRQPGLTTSDGSCFGPCPRYSRRLPNPAAAPSFETGCLWRHMEDIGERTGR